MTGTYKEFYNFVKLNSPTVCALWEDFNKRPDPQVGDEYIYFEPIPQIGVSYTSTIVFDKVLFDDKFENGVAFYYIFHRKDNGEEVRIHTINNVYDFDKLTADDRQDLFGFWRNCVPIYK